jgi:uncharacterized protein involved in response to NO
MNSDKQDAMLQAPAVDAVSSPGAVGGAVMGARPAASNGPWKAQRLMDAPHRVAFYAGALMLALSALWWAGVTASWLVPGLQIRWAVPFNLAHAALMSFGFMPLFFTGFLFTAGPKWLGVPAVSAQALMPCILLSCAGWLVYLMGVHGLAHLAAIGLGAVTLGWAGFVWQFWALVRASGVADKLHARVIAVACTVGVGALLTCAAGFMFDSPAAVRIGLGIGLWWFLAPVYAAVLHRMIPFFTHSAVPTLDAWRPNWLLWSWLFALAAQVPLTLLDHPVAQPLRLLVDVPAAVLLLAIAVRWGFVQSLSIRLLAMLHVGFLWLGIAFTLLALSAAVSALTDGAHDLGRAPLHALTMGFLGSTMVAMVTRVSCGHGGRSLVADDYVWRLFLALQGAVVLRVAAELVPTAASGWALALAGLVWAAVMVPWSWRHMGWYGRTRLDGKPG